MNIFRQRNRLFSLLGSGGGGSWDCDGFSLLLFISFLLSHLGVLLSSGLHLGLELLSSLLFVSLSMDSFDQHSLVLVLVTLRVEVELMMEGLIDLSTLSVLSKQSSEGSLSSDPKNLDWQSGVSGTSSLTNTGVSSSSLGDFVESSSGSAVNLNGLLHDQTILDELLDGATGGGEGNLAGFVRVEEDSSLSALEHGGCESLLMSEVCHLSFIINFDGWP